MTIAHELGHVGSLTIAASLGVAPALAATSIADYDGALAIAAAEEFRAERNAIALTGQFLQAHNAEGGPVDIWAPRRAALLVALGPVLDGIIEAGERIAQSFAGALDPAALWDQVDPLVSGAVSMLGYFEGCHAEEAAAFAVIDHPAVATVAPCVGPLFAYLSSEPVVPPPGAWLEDRARIREIGGAGIDELYRSLGLLRTDSPGGMTLSFVEPV
jgi:hypothetical protein